MNRLRDSFSRFTAAFLTVGQLAWGLPPGFADTLRGSQQAESDLAGLEETLLGHPRPDVHPERSTLEPVPAVLSTNLPLAAGLEESWKPDAERMARLRSAVLQEIDSTPYDNPGVTRTQRLEAYKALIRKLAKNEEPGGILVTEQDYGLLEFNRTYIYNAINFVSKTSALLRKGNLPDAFYSASYALLDAAQLYFQFSVPAVGTRFDADGNIERFLFRPRGQIFPTALLSWLTLWLMTGQVEHLAYGGLYTAFGWFLFRFRPRADGHEWTHILQQVLLERIRKEQQVPLSGWAFDSLFPPAVFEKEVAFLTLEPPSHRRLHTIVEDLFENAGAQLTQLGAQLASPPEAPKTGLETDSRSAAAEIGPLMDRVEKVLSDRGVEQIGGKLGRTITETTGDRLFIANQIAYLPTRGLKRLVVLGDLHGDEASLDRALVLAGWDSETNSLPDETALVSVGDRVNLGHKSAEVERKLLSLMLKYPDRVVLLVGNHDADAATEKSPLVVRRPSSGWYFRQLNEALGPAEGARVYAQSIRLAGKLPVALAVGNGFVVVHGDAPFFQPASVGQGLLAIADPKIQGQLIHNLSVIESGRLSDEEEDRVKSDILVGVDDQPASFVGRRSRNAFLDGMEAIFEVGGHQHQAPPIPEERDRYIGVITTGKGSPDADLLFENVIARCLIVPLDIPAKEINLASTVHPLWDTTAADMEQKTIQFIVDTGQRGSDAGALMALAAAGAKMWTREPGRVEFAAVATEQELKTVLAHPSLNGASRGVLEHRTFTYDPMDAKSHAMALEMAQVTVPQPQRVIDRVSEQTLAWFRGAAERLGLLDLYQEFQGGLEALQEAA